MKAIKRGDEVVVSYINCEDDRKSRMKELKFGWNFDCACDRFLEN